MFQLKLPYLYIHTVVFVLLLFGNNFINMELTPFTTEDVEDLAAACHSFCHNLYKILASTDENNLVYSPIGLHSLLALLSFGANNSTHEELITALNLPHDKLDIKYKGIIPFLLFTDAINLTISTAIYVQNDFPVLKSYLEFGLKHFYAEIANLDFADKEKTVNKINLWIQEKTKNKLTSAIEPTDFDEFTRVILLNIVYFKGVWRNVFDYKKTDLKEFHVSKLIVKKVPTMVTEANFRIGTLSNLQTDVIELPYKDPNFIMLILKPKDINGLSSLENKFHPEMLSKINMSKTMVKLQMPRFKFEIMIDLKDKLQQMGIQTMFGDKADFSKISDSKNPLQVSKVFQKMVIDVGEEGTEAAAVTGVVMRLRRSLTIIENDFIIDRPFMFILQHKPSDIPLFMGSVRDLPEIPTFEPIKDEL